MKEIQLTLSIDEANLVLEGLGLLPFVKVYTLIGKIQKQAGQQFAAENGEAESQTSDMQLPQIGD